MCWMEAAVSDVVVGVDGWLLVLLQFGGFSED